MEKKVEKSLPQALKSKPIKLRGGLIGTRELTNNFNENSTLDIPKQKKGEVRLLFFGGLGEIGKNITALEYEDEIIILDCGLAFSNPNTPGVSLIVPNIKYLEERKDKIKCILISHGHLDHVGGIGILSNKLGNPPIFSRRLSIEIIKNRQKEYESKKPLIYHEVENDREIKITENIKLNFFAVTHSIPDAMGIIIDTPVGSFVYTGDLKLDHVDCVVDKKEEKNFEIFKNKKILLSMADSTNADMPGFSIPESKALETLKILIKETKGRIILAAFASSLERLINIIEFSIANGRKIVVQGLSIVTNLRIAFDMGLLDVPHGSIIPVDKMENYPREKIIIFATGAQADNFSAMDRMSRELHKYIKIDEKDTTIFSSSVIPGNEEPVQLLKDRLATLGTNIITYKTSDVHSSGHANRDELKWIHRKINAEYFIPVHGYHYMLSAHGKILEELGMKKENIVIAENGSIVDIDPEKNEITQQEYMMPTELNVVDGNAIGPIQEVVLKDRTKLKTDGILSVIILINQKLKKVKKSPDIISRGFVYLKESHYLINRSRMIAKRVAEENMRKGNSINIDIMKKNIIKNLQRFLYSETKKRPIIVPVIFIT